MGLLLKNIVHLDASKKEKFGRTKCTIGSQGRIENWIGINWFAIYGSKVDLFSRGIGIKPTGSIWFPSDSIDFWKSSTLNMSYEDKTNFYSFIIIMHLINHTFQFSNS